MMKTNTNGRDRNRQTAGMMPPDEETRNSGKNAKLERRKDKDQRGEVADTVNVLLRVMVWMGSRYWMTMPARGLSTYVPELYLRLLGRKVAPLVTVGRWDLPGLIRRLKRMSTTRTTYPDVDNTMHLADGMAHSPHFRPLLDSSVRREIDPADPPVVSSVEAVPAKQGRLTRVKKETIDVSTKQCKRPGGSRGPCLQTSFKREE